MGKVVAHISVDTAAKYVCRDIPIEPEHDVREEPKGCCEGEEQRWGHDESELIHRQKMMDSVKQKMQCYRHSTIWHYPGTPTKKLAMVP